MMKFKLYLFSAILAVMPFISGGCSNKNVSYEDAGTVWSGLFSNHDSKTVRKTLSLKNFHGINVVSLPRCTIRKALNIRWSSKGAAATLII